MPAPARRLRRHLRPPTVRLARSRPRSSAPTFRSRSFQTAPPTCGASARGTRASAAPPPRGCPPRSLAGAEGDRSARSRPTAPAVVGAVDVSASPPGIPCPDNDHGRRRLRGPSSHYAEHEDTNRTPRGGGAGPRRNARLRWPDARLGHRPTSRDPDSPGGQRHTLLRRAVRDHAGRRPRRWATRLRGVLGRGEAVDPSTGVRRPHPPPSVTPRLLVMAGKGGHHSGPATKCGFRSTAIRCGSGCRSRSRSHRTD